MLNEKFKIIENYGPHKFLVLFENGAIYNYNAGLWTFVNWKPELGVTE